MQKIWDLILKTKKIGPKSHCHSILKEENKRSKTGQYGAISMKLNDSVTYSIVSVIEYKELENKFTGKPNDMMEDVSLLSFEIQQIQKIQIDWRESVQIQIQSPLPSSM